MPVKETAAYPIQTLREHVTALEAAITLSLADPKPRYVHRLRTSTRRIEAQLALLGLLPDLPEHAKLAGKVRKRLGKLRRAAGSVRDLDVQIDLVEGAKPKTSKSKPAADLEKEARSLNKLLERLRDQEADALRHLLTKQQAKISLSLENLLQCLQPSESIALTPAHLSDLTREWYVHNTPVSERSNTDDPDHLHAIRKSAKLARYIAESATPVPAASTGKAAGSPKTTQLAQQFEALQQSGGTWHDLLTLAEIAREHLGKHSSLTEHFGRQQQKSLAEYQKHLESFPQRSAPVITRTGKIHS